MKRHLNTLFVSTEGAYLHKEGESIGVKVEREVRLRIPIHTLQGVVCFGQVTLTPYLMHFCAERNVAITYLSEHGRFLARVVGPVSGNVLLRREQYRWADLEERSTEVARAITAGKILNARSVLRRACRDHGDDGRLENVRKAAKRLAQHARKLEQASTLEEVRGLEGDASRSYFSVFDSLITAQKEGFVFTGRNRRPPRDNVNCLLSFVYTLLMHDVRSALETVGLDPQVGFLHRDRSGRCSLALDMMEEFRAAFADRLVLSLINLKQIQPRNMTISESGGVTMKNDARKQLLIAYQKRKQDEVEHPFLGEKVSIGLLFHVQAMLLARHIRGDLDGYPPMIWK
jgi:CRISPR-associated protein Cas1